MSEKPPTGQVISIADYLGPTGGSSTPSPSATAPTLSISEARRSAAAGSRIGSTVSSRSSARCSATAISPCSMSTGNGNGSSVEGRDIAEGAARSADDAQRQAAAAIAAATGVPPRRRATVTEVGSGSRLPDESFRVLKHHDEKAW
jgi:hypothetical protein